MKKIKLQINKNFLDNYAKDRFTQIAGSDEKWTEVHQKLQDVINPQCIYAVFDDIKIKDDKLTVGDEVFTSQYFASLPEEIIGQVAVYVMTIGDFSSLNDENSVVNNTLIDMAGTAYIDALRSVLRTELNEEYLVSGTVAPGLDGMDISQVAKIDSLIDFTELGISINDAYILSPEKSYSGMFMLFNEAHPISTNSCATCMARGHGCNFCSEKGE